MVVNALHGKQHALLFAGGQNLTQAPQQRFLGLFPADTRLFCHIGGLAAHAASAQCFCYGDLAQHFGHFRFAFLLIGIAQLHIGAVYSNADVGSFGRRAGSFYQGGGHIGIAFNALNGLGKRQLCAAETCLPDGRKQRFRGLTAKIMAACSNDKFRHGRSSLTGCSAYPKIRWANMPSSLPHQYQSWETSLPHSSTWQGRAAASSAACSALVSAQASSS